MKRLFMLSTTVVFVLLAVALTIDWYQQAEAAVLIPETGLNPILPQPPPEQYTFQVMIVPPNSGSVLVEPTKPFYSYGEVVWLTGKPSTGFVFAQWYEEGTTLGSDNPMGHAVIANHKIIAYFLAPGQVLPSPPFEWQEVVPFVPPSPSPPPPFFAYILLIIPIIMILGVVILTVTFRPKWLRLVGLILGVVGALAGFPASFLSCLGSFQSPWSLGLGYVAFSWLIHFAILILAYKWALIGGMLLILDSSLLGIFLGRELANLSWLARPFLDALVSGFWLFTFLLLLASGVLFILSWMEGRKHLELST